MKLLPLVHFNFKAFHLSVMKVIETIILSWITADIRVFSMSPMLEIFTTDELVHNFVIIYYADIIKQV